jgi:hypothetical protein
MFSAKNGSSGITDDPQGITDTQFLAKNIPGGARNIPLGIKNRGFLGKNAPLLSTHKSQEQEAHHGCR